MLDKEAKYPLTTNDQPLKSLIYLKHFITKAHIQVGDYTYYHSRKAAEAFERENVLYDGEGMGLQLLIGKFCQIATDVKFMCPYGEHHIHSFTTYPFFWKDQQTAITIPDRKHFSTKEPTRVGHDVWLGYNSLVMPGVQIGSGAIIATRSVVTKNVPAYTIVGGNPAKVIRMRFDEVTIKQLLELAWWDWPIEIIEANYQQLLNCDLEQLQQVKKDLL